MPQAGSFVSVSPPAFDSFPYGVDHRSSRGTAVVLLALLAALGSVVLVPLALVVAYAPHDLEDALAHKPLAVGMLAAGGAVWIGLLVTAGVRVVRNSWTRRCVTVTAERVVVSSARLIGSTLRINPTAEFCGITHRIRATLTGVRHELVLVHPVRNRSVLLHAADAISEATIGRATALFRLPQVPAGDLYGRTRPVAGPAVMPSLPGATQPA